MEKIIKLRDCHIKEVKCCHTSGYNSHNYTIIYDNETGRYIGEIEDCYWEDSSFSRKLKKLVETEG